MPFSYQINAWFNKQEWESKRKGERQERGKKSKENIDGEKMSLFNKHIVSDQYLSHTTALDHMWLSRVMLIDW